MAVRQRLAGMRYPSGCLHPLPRASSCPPALPTPLPPRPDCQPATAREQQGSGRRPFRPAPRCNYSGAVSCLAWHHFLDVQSETMRVPRVCAPPWWTRPCTTPLAAGQDTHGARTPSWGQYMSACVKAPSQLAVHDIGVQGRTKLAAAVQFGLPCAKTGSLQQHLDAKPRSWPLPRADGNEHA